jgi:DDE superfamily endonuclease
MPDTARSGALGFAGVGFAVPVRPSPLRALRSRARQASQDVRRMGVAVAVARQALVAEREIVAVADSTYASLRLLDRCRSLSNPIAFITRLRLDAALYEPAPPPRPGQMGRPRLKGERLPNLSVVADDPHRLDTDDARPLVRRR